MTQLYFAGVAFAACLTALFAPPVKGVKAKEKVEIAEGPRNPVGSVWIDLTKASYGIHGTAHPETIGKTESHGCVRLTNWDATELAHRVAKATVLVFLD
jgi:lipoprotein-anchoring transpeptidase ErfK/SrfK